ncbi:MAG: WD40 repeat domain-containing protein [Pirellulaceae bacterium]
MVRHRFGFASLWYTEGMRWATVINGRRVIQTGIESLMKTGYGNNIGTEPNDIPVVALSGDGTTAAIANRGRIGLLHDLKPPFDRPFNIPNLNRLGLHEIEHPEAESPFPSFLTADLLRSDFAVETLSKQANRFNHVHSYAESKSMAHDDVLTALRFDRSGKRLLTASADGTARIWDVDRQIPIGRAMIHGKAIQSAKFSPDERYVATGSVDGGVRVWDASNGHPLIPLLPHHDSVAALCWSESGNLLAVLLTDGKIQIWDLHTIARDRPLQWTGAISAMKLGNAGKRLAVGTQAGEVGVLSLEDSTCIKALSNPLSAPVRSLQWIGDDTLAIITGRLHTDEFTELYRWSLSDDSPKAMCDAVQQHSHPCNCQLQFDADRNRLFVLRSSRFAAIDIAGDAPVFEHHREFAGQSWIDQFVVSPDGETVALVQNETPRPADAVGEPIKRRDFLPDGDDGAAIQILRTDDGRHVASFSPPSGSQFRGALWHPTRNELLAYGDFGFVVWDSQHGGKLFDSNRVVSGIRFAKFSSDGKYLVTARYDDQCQVWSGVTFTPLGSAFRLNDSSVFLDFLDDPRIVAAVAANGDAQLFDWFRGEPLSTRYRLPARVSTAAFNADRTLLNIGCEDGTVRRWKLPHPDQRTIEEIARFVSEQPLKDED